MCFCVVDCGLLYDGMCFASLAFLCLCAAYTNAFVCVFNANVCCLEFIARIGVCVLFVVGGVRVLSVWFVYTCVSCVSFIV